MDRELENLLNRDPVAEAEELIRLGDKIGAPPLEGRDRDLALLGYGIGVNKLKSQALLERDDTDYSTKLDRYKRIIGELGFREVLRLPFEGRSYGEPRTDEFYIYFRDKGGLLLAFDTYYGGETVNSGHLYYNWKPTREDYNKYHITSSGGWRFNCPPELDVTFNERYVNGVEQKTPEIMEKDRKRKELFMKTAIWSGDHDCRTALRHNIQKLEEFGEFVTPWVDTPHLWLLHWMDTKDNSGEPLDWRLIRNKEINAERIAMLPADVRAAMGM